MKEIVKTIIIPSVLDNFQLNGRQSTGYKLKVRFQRHYFRVVTIWNLNQVTRLFICYLPYKITLFIIRNLLILNSLLLIKLV